MDLDALKATASQLISQLINLSGELIQVFKKAVDDYKRADNFEVFFKTFVKEELSEKPERIVPTAITVWILILLITHWKFWIVFVFGILPIILYHLLKIFKKTPQSEY